MNPTIVITDVIIEDAGKRERELQGLTRIRVCAECSGTFFIPWSQDENKTVLLCGEDVTHVGIRWETSTPMPWDFDG